MKSIHTLLYVHDPMCSWCYGFKPTLTKIISELKGKINIQYMLGGLAPDTDKDMPLSLQNSIKSNWKQIEKTIPNIKFNYDFWALCKPRRSTYPSCRAVIAATKQHHKYEKLMIEAIQSAYYLHSQNTSDYNVLYELAKAIELDVDLFFKDIHSNKINIELNNQISHCRIIGADSFPSLFLSTQNSYQEIALDYNDAKISLEHIKAFI